MNFARNEEKTLSLVLAAGKGKRLLPLTENMPKALLDARGRKMIDYVFDIIPESTSLAVLIKNEPKFDSLRDYLITHPRKPKILYQNNNFYYSVFPSMLFILFQQCQKSENSRYLQKFDRFVLLPTDILIENINLTDILRFHKERNSHLTLINSDRKQEGSSTKIIKVNRDRIFEIKSTSLFEKERRIGGSEVYSTHTGIYVVEKSLLNQKLSTILFYYMSGLGYRKFKIFRYPLDCFWIDLGNKEAFEKYNT